MDAHDMVQAAACWPGQLVVNHLEALDHCPTTRAQVHALGAAHGLSERLWVPEDGECRRYDPGPGAATDRAAAECEAATATAAAGPALRPAPCA